MKGTNATKTKPKKKDNGVIKLEICYKTNKPCIHKCNGLCRESC